VYLECCAEQLPDNLQQQQQQQEAGAVTAVSHALATAKASTSNAAVQCEDSCLLNQQHQQHVQCADAGCQVLLLHVADLPAVGPPIECRVCPLLHKQLQETQQRLEAALEQHKQVRWAFAWLSMLFLA
jgi:co-chaperonin GroES (HSP10)